MDRSKEASTIALAFLGDSIYEFFVRDRLMEGPIASVSHADRLHRAAVRYVCAAAQAASLAAISDELTEQETALVKRARNHRIATKPKNTDAVTYKQATAFEALLGWLWLRGEKERALALMEKAALFIEQENEG
ncbi:MAG: ribonuclease III [Firmicutes bacterium]|nr:ribonuclease III [Bacillota bacterium]MBQ6014226.1 ribonuclease III [Bacillota bacterium]MBQ6261251.1 ribonuclease III [Bacillota bacterium]MBR0114090.1 ribonuclease III [Bacillota bacterium]MBR0442641.1 ribonuclease III [Bacillota bacterium]